MAQLSFRLEYQIFELISVELVKVVRKQNFGDLDDAVFSNFLFAIVLGRGCSFE
jgi:hypothetical protein